MGTLEHFPDGMREFKKGYHDGLVLDDLRDFHFLVAHQDRGRTTAHTAGPAPQGGAGVVRR